MSDKKEGTMSIEMLMVDEMKEFGEMLLKHLGLRWNEVEHLTLEMPGEFKCEMTYYQTAAQIVEGK